MIATVVLLVVLARDLGATSGSGWRNGLVDAGVAFLAAAVAAALVLTVLGVLDRAREPSPSAGAARSWSSR